MNFKSLSLQFDYNKTGSVEYRNLLRWDIFEQSFENESKRWSKPYVPLIKYEHIGQLGNELKSKFYIYQEDFGKKSQFEALESIVEKIKSNQLLKDSLASIIRKSIFVFMIDKKEEKKDLSLKCCKHPIEEMETSEIIKNILLVSSLKDVDDLIILIVFTNKSHILQTFWLFNMNFDKAFILSRTVGRLLLLQNPLLMSELLNNKDDFIKCLLDTGMGMTRICCKDSFESGWIPDNSLVIKKIEDPVLIPEESFNDLESIDFNNLGKFILFSGLIQDIKRRSRHYLSDFTDALHFQTITSFVFMYFACLTPIITFGGILSKETENHLGTIESLVSGSICAVIYALFAGQPLTLLGSTGPILVFESIIYKMCKEYDILYLSFRLWIGIWICIILIIIVATNANKLVKYITRFTEDIFAALITLIYIVEPIKGLIHILQENPLKRSGNLSCNWTNPDYDAQTYQRSLDACKDTSNIFLFSILLTLGTYWAYLFMNKVNTLRLFPTVIRDFISNSSVIISILLLTLIDYTTKLDTQKLEVPNKLIPTLQNQNRTWTVEPFGSNSLWTCILAVIPALLAVILIFLDQQITAAIINKNKDLKKGSGYDLDMLVLALLILINSILGCPWFVAATVLSINHISSLKTRSESMRCREQRVTGLLVGITMGVSILLTPVLKMIPMAVLYGVFIIMGSSSFGKIVFIKRLKLIFIPRSDHSEYEFLSHVTIKRMHLFTAIQFASFAVIWVVKSIKIISLGFPLMVMAMCFIRKGLECIFTKRELYWLDELYPEQKYPATVHNNDVELKYCQNEFKNGTHIQDNNAYESEKISTDGATTS